MNTKIHSRLIRETLWRSLKHVLVTITVRHIEASGSSQSVVQSVSWKFEGCSTTPNLLRHGRPPTPTSHGSSSPQAAWACGEHAEGVVLVKNKHRKEKKKITQRTQSSGAAFCREALGIWFDFTARWAELNPAVKDLKLTPVMQEFRLISCPSQSPELIPTENSWQDLRVVVHRGFVFSLKWKVSGKKSQFLPVQRR